MILGCPDCGRRYRVPDDGGPERKVRCGVCGRVFTAAEGMRSGEEHSPAAAPPESQAARPPGPIAALVGDEPREFRDLVRSTLERLGCRVETTEDGEAAFRYAVARRPTLMVLNVYLKKLLGVAVCEGVKGSPDLRRTRVALVGSVFKSDRFIRHPGNLYGADDYFEDVIPEPQLRARLAALLGRAIPRAPGAPDASAPAPGGDAFASDDPLIVASGPLAPNGADEPIDPRSEIHRLARIMVSDLKIYHPDEFRRAVLERRIAESFREELTQAKDLIARRFPDMPDRMAVLTEALRDEIAVERRAAAGAAAEAGR